MWPCSTCSAAAKAAPTLLGAECWPARTVQRGGLKLRSTPGHPHGPCGPSGCTARKARPVRGPGVPGLALSSCGPRAGPRWLPPRPPRFQGRERLAHRGAEKDKRPGAWPRCQRPCRAGGGSRGRTLSKGHAGDTAVPRPMVPPGTEGSSVLQGQLHRGLYLFHPSTVYHLVPSKPAPAPPTPEAALLGLAANRAGSAQDRQQVPRALTSWMANAS